MASEFRLPDIGEGLTEAELVTWHVAPGDPVASGDVLCEVETAKAVVELPSPFTGVVLHLGAEEGQTVSVGSTLVVVGDPGEQWHPEPETLPSQDRPTPATSPPPTAVKAMPVVRRLAKEHGVDLAGVTGTGPGGRITREDVLAAAQGPGESPAAERLSPTRRAIAEHLTRSWREIPHVTTYDDVDATEIVAARSASNPPPIEALMIAAVVPALAACPEFNATLDGDVLTKHPHTNIGVAVDTDDGLLVPVVNDVAGKDIDTLAEEVAALAEAARRRTLLPGQMRGATFTISNIGAVGGGHGTPIIPLGTTAILSFGRIEQRAVVREGSIVAAPLMPLSLSYDHRVIDGALGRRFIDALVGALASPATFGR